MTLPDGSGSPPVRVLVADAAPLFRSGVVAALAGEPAVDVVAQVGDAVAVEQAVQRERPDVVVLDAWLDGHGLATCEALRAAHPQLRLLVVANPAASADLARVAAAGATGYLRREAEPQELVDCVLATAQGRVLLSPDLATQLMGELAGLALREDLDRDGEGARSGGVRLSARELEVLRLVAEGLGNRAIAERLFISENTVKNHVRSVHEKLQVHSRTEAVIRAVRAGLLDGLLDLPPGQVPAG